MPSQKTPCDKNSYRYITGMIEYVADAAAFCTVTLDGLEEPIHGDIRLKVVGTQSNPFGGGKI